MGFVIDWKKKLGYKKDPFKGLKAKPKELLVARTEEREKLNLFIIKQSKLAIVNGEKGIGKTLLLYWLYEQVHGSINTLVINDQKIISSKALMFNHLFDELTGIVDRVVKKTAEMSEEQKIRLLLDKLKKKALLIIDDADKLSSKNQELLSLLMEKTELQIILSCEKEDFTFKKPDLKLNLEGLKETNFENLLKKRISLVGGYQIFPFTSEIVKKLTKSSKNNPAKFLEQAREEAIELSLKVKEAPKPDNDSKNNSNLRSKEKKSWFGIRFEKDKDEKALFVIKGDDDEDIDIVQATKSNNKSNSKNTINNKQSTKDSSDDAEDIQDFLESLAKEVK